MAENEKAVITVLCMIYKENKILLQDRLKEDWKGLVFPGGHVEKSEPFVKAVIREMKEETGLDIYNPKLCGVKQFQTDNDVRYIVLLFKTNEFSGKLTSSDEGKIQWFSREQLKDEKRLVADFFKLLRVFDEEETTEFIYERNIDNDWVVKLY